MCRTKRLRKTLWSDPLHREGHRRGGRRCTVHRHPALCTPARDGTRMWSQRTPPDTCTDDQHVGTAQVIVAQGDALCHHLCPPLCLKSLCHQQEEEKSFLSFNPGIQAGKGTIIVIKQLG